MFDGFYSHEAAFLWKVLQYLLLKPRICLFGIPEASRPWSLVLRSPIVFSVCRVPSPEPQVEEVEKRPVRKCRQRPIVELAIVDSTGPDENDATGNPYVADVLLLEKTSSKENFDDLKDFIVCKTGRSYTKWLHRRSKFRRRKRTREIWKRAEHKKKLLSMLNIV